MKTKTLLKIITPIFILVGGLFYAGYYLYMYDKKIKQKKYNVKIYGQVLDKPLTGDTLKEKFKWCNSGWKEDDEDRACIIY